MSSFPHAYHTCQAFPTELLFFTMTSQVTEHHDVYASSDFEMPDEKNVLHRVSIPADCTLKSMSRKYANAHHFVARGTPGAYLTYIGTGNSGAKGIVATTKNICSSFYKTGNCSRSQEKCRFYHMRIGRIASALPGLAYHDMGNLNAAGRSTPHLAEQLVWSKQDLYGKADAFKTEHEASLKRVLELEADLDEADRRDEQKAAMKRRFAIQEARAAKREAAEELQRNIPIPSFCNLSAITYVEPVPIETNQGDAPDPNPEGTNEPEAEASCVKAEPIEVEAITDSTNEPKAEVLETDVPDSEIDELLHQPMDGQVDAPLNLEASTEAQDDEVEMSPVSPATPPLSPVSAAYSTPESPMSTGDINASA